MRTELDEQHESLWPLAVPPLIWAVHFLLSYMTAAVWCAKVAGRDGSLLGARAALAVYTAVGLFALFSIGFRGYRRYRVGQSRTQHRDTPEDRYRFLGYATMLLAGLSAIALVYAALVVVFIGSCR